MKKLTISVLLLLFVLPFIFMALLSVADTWRFPDLWPEGWTLRYWAAVQDGGRQWATSALLSLGLALTVGISATVSGFLVAQQLSGHARRPLFLRLAYFPYAFSPVIYGFTMKFFFNMTLLSGTFWGVWLAQYMLVFPFAVLLFFNHFDSYFQSMEQLSYTLGASPLVTFWKVMAPASRPALLICFFQTFLISWFEYGLTSVIGLGQVRTLTISVYQYIGEANIYVAALSGCLLCLPPVVLLWINQRYIFAANRLKLTD